MSLLAKTAFLLSNISSPEASSMISTLTDHTPSMLVVCCNGGLPFVDLHVWPVNGARFHPLDMTDWVATATSGSDLNRTIHPEIASWLDALNLPTDADLAYCDAFNLTFSAKTSQDLFNERNGTLSCRCPRYYFGNRCEINASPLASSGESSLKIFLYLAIIPLLAMGAAVAFFLCKQCCCDCFGCHCFITPCCTESDDVEWGGNADEMEPLDDNTLNRCMEAVKVSEDRDRDRFNQFNTRETSDSTPQPLDVIQASYSATNDSDIYLGQARCQASAPVIPGPPNNHNNSPPPAYRPKDPSSKDASRPNSITVATQTPGQS